MRNLKKVLALVLVMALALTTFAGATAVQFDDTKDASAAQQEAITVLSTLGVINGYTDGTFRPSDIVTRAELAKMLYVIKTGDPTATFYGNADLSKVFKDSVDTWAVPFVNYAYLNGIMVGYEDKTVRANQQVTGVEAAKMALVALGYLPKTEGLEGDNYYNNTVRLASVAGLLKNLGTANMSEGLTRADTAVLLYNALYANTVQYIGGAATPKTEALSSTDTITLGEEGFNLLDVTGVLVANDQASLSAYWRDVLNENTGSNNIPYYGSLVYRQYEKAASGQSRFVYKDYANDANPSGGYTDKVVTVGVDTDFAQLGHSYRLLITKASNSAYSSTEVRTVYGILGEAGGATITTKNVAKQGTSILTNMIARYNLNKADAAKVVYGSDDNSALGTNTTVGVNAIVDATDGTIFVNGAVASFGAAKKALNQNTTAKATYVDNDNDGTVDSLFIEQYTLGTINAVSDTSYTIYGTGVIGKDVSVLTNGDVAQGDYVAYYKNAAEGKYYIKKLNVITSNVSGFDGSAYTIGGAAYSEGSLLDDSSKGILKNTYGLVGSTIYKFVTDEDDASKLLVNVSTSAETSFSSYAIVKSILPSSYLGNQQIELFTEDNQTIAVNVTYINGVPAAASGVTLAANDLVSYTQVGNDVYLYTADYAFNSTATVAQTGLTMLFNPTTQTWSSATGTYVNTNGVVFVGNETAWRAYRSGEFVVAAGSDFTLAAKNTANDDVVVSIPVSGGFSSIKAAAITFDAGVTLPGIVGREGRSFVATITGTANVQTAENNQWVTTYSVLNASATTSTSYSTIASAGYLNNLQKGGIYRLFINADGAIESATALYVNGVSTPDTYGTSIVKVQAAASTTYPTGTALATYTYTNATTPLTASTTYMLDSNTKVYFGKNIGTVSFATQDPTTLTYTLGNMLPNLSVAADFDGDGTYDDTNYYTIYLEVTQTGTVVSIWIDTTTLNAFGS